VVNRSKKAVPQNTSPAMCLVLGYGKYRTNTGTNRHPLHLFYLALPSAFSIQELSEVDGWDLVYIFQNILVDVDQRSKNYLQSRSKVSTAPLLKVERLLL
jgi:hypothetical protein